MNTFLSVLSPTVKRTESLGMALGHHLNAGDIICLSGDLGAGKTVFARGVGTGWGAQEPVNSPTFVFIHEHRRALDDVRLYHADAYRLANAVEAESIGLTDLLAQDNPTPAIVLLEWPERVLACLPDDYLWIEIDRAQEEQAAEEITARLIMFQPHGQRAAKLTSILADIAQSLDQ